MFKARHEFSEHQWARSAGFCRQCAFATTQTNKNCRPPPNFAWARAFVKKSRTKFCVRVVKRQITELLRKRQQTTNTAGHAVAGHLHATCPTCGAVVVAGSRTRVRIVHTRPDGQSCPTTQWRSAQSNMHEHVCPACGTSVHSRLESGRIRVKHKRPNGVPCPCVDWTVTPNKKSTRKHGTGHALTVTNR